MQEHSIKNYSTNDDFYTSENFLILCQNFEKFGLLSNKCKCNLSLIWAELCLAMAPGSAIYNLTLMAL